MVILISAMQLHRIKVSREVLSGIRALTNLERLAFRRQSYGVNTPLAEDEFNDSEPPVEELWTTLESLSKLKFLDLSHITMRPELVSQS